MPQWVGTACSYWKLRGKERAENNLHSGEGGLMMNIQELSTAMHHSMPIKLFIYNNGGYLTIKQTQQLGFEGRLMGLTMKVVCQLYHLNP